jgi:hypothetical protein
MVLALSWQAAGGAAAVRCVPTLSVSTTVLLCQALFFQDA